MEEYEIVVTDVTRYGDKYCVAGWDLNRNVMVRPEPPTAMAAAEASRFWSAQAAGPDKFFAVGNVVKFYANGPSVDFQFPHATEDRLVQTQHPSNVVSKLTLAETVAAVGGSVSHSLQAVFGGQLIRAASEKAYVPAGSQTVSLGAIQIAPDKIAFYVEQKDNGKQQLRALVRQGVLDYDLSVTADAAKARWTAGGLQALKDDVMASANLHLRIGLSRPFNAMPNSCYAQINGIFCL